MENIECPLCGEEHPQGSRFCPTTGQSLENPTRAPSRDSDPQEKSVEIKQIDPEEKPIFLTEMSPVALDLEGWMDDDALRAALEGLVSRNRDGQARQLLDVLTQEPDNATAWIWLAREAQAGVEKRACLQKALQLEPEHAAARLAWTDLDPLPTRQESAAVYEGGKVESDGDDEPHAALEEEEAPPEEDYSGIELPEEALIQIVEAEDETPEPETSAGSGRVFESLLDIEPAMDLPEDEPQPAPLAQDWQETTYEENVVDQTLEAVISRPRRRASASQITLMVILALLLATNIWTALSIVRLERTVEALETQTADTNTLISAFQEMVVDLLVRVDMISPSGP
jgi:hypothetical protein